MTCIFCKIIQGEVPASKVYEDDDLIAFMDLFPIHEGHVLVARLERSVWKSGLHCEGTNILQSNGKAAGQDVPHVHFHIVPRPPDDGFRFKYTALKPSRAELDQTAQTIRQSLENQLMII